jgi:hypothetical protein
VKTRVSAALTHLARRLLAGPTEPELVERALRAGLVLRLGLALLRDVGRPRRRSRTLRSTQLAGFEPGDRIRVGELAIVTDLAEAACEECEYLLTTESSQDFRIGIARLTRGGLRRTAAQNVARLLGELTREQLRDLQQAISSRARKGLGRPGAATRISAERARRLRRQTGLVLKVADQMAAEADRVEMRAAGKGGRR